MPSHTADQLDGLENGIQQNEGQRWRGQRHTIIKLATTVVAGYYIRLAFMYTVVISCTLRPWLTKDVTPQRRRMMALRTGANVEDEGLRLILAKIERRLKTSSAIFLCVI